MCLAIPGEVTEIRGGSTPLMGKVNFGGVLRDTCLEWVPDVRVGDFVIVHVGFAISTVSPEEAKKTIDLLSEIEAHGQGTPPGDRSEPESLP